MNIIRKCLAFLHLLFRMLILFPIACVLIVLLLLVVVLGHGPHKVRKAMDQLTKVQL